MRSMRQPIKHARHATALNHSILAGNVSGGPSLEPCIGNPVARYVCSVTAKVFNTFDQAWWKIVLGTQLEAECMLIQSILATARSFNHQILLL